MLSSTPKTSPLLGSPNNKGSSILSPLFDPLRALQAPIWVFDIDHARIISANAAACRLWDADSEEELLSRDLKKDMSATVAERLCQYQKSFVASEEFFTELWTLYPKGNPVHVKVVFSRYPLTDGRMAMMCEVREELAKEPETIRASEALLYTDVMITLYSTRGDVLYSNPSSRRSLIEAKNTFFARIRSKPLNKEIVAKLARDGEFRRVIQVHTAGGLRWHNISIKSCFDSVTGNAAMLVTEENVTDLKNAQERESYLASHDPLTGLYNRTFLQNFAEDPHSFRRENSELSALFYIDIDRFKHINDTQGHDFGDTVLVTIAQRLQNSVRQSDTVLRLGGDEFIILIKGKAAELENIAQRIREAVNEPMEINGTSFCASCSIGIARYPEDGDQFDTLMRNADLALYAAKNGGRKIHRYFNAAMHEEAKNRFELEADLTRALDNEEFLLHYQPRVDINTDRIVGVEGLARWNHPQRGLILPGEFIPICEETGLIEILGEQVLAMAAKQQASWSKSGYQILVSANLSPRQFHSRKLLPLIRSLVEIPGVEPSLLEFEITENVLMGNNEQAMTTLNEIRGLGFNIALDDFGTGYSNLAYIPRYPIGCIKIDKSFIDQLPHSSPVIGLILSLGSQIGAKVVAEGVETRKQLAQLRKWKCEEYQGYLFQRPMPVDVITLLLEKQHRSQVRKKAAVT